MLAAMLLASAPLAWVFASMQPATTTIAIGNCRLTAKVAQSEAEQEQGLMGVRYLPPDEGMLFAGSHETEDGFWMKGTPLPLSIAFLDANGAVVALSDLVPHSLKVTRPSKPAKFAIEANKGYFKRCGLKVGDGVRVSV